MCSDATNGEYEGFKVSDEIGCSWEGKATTSESRLHLSDLLEMLIRLDQQGIFMKPVDDSIAPDYFKVIKNPMCFLRMREKIDAQQYPSWSSFSEDFEHICYNAMKYNQKRSQIWNAANLMLRQGKKYLEQQLSKHTVILGLNNMHRGYNHEGNNVAEVKSSVNVVAHEIFVPSVKEMRGQIIANENLSAGEVNGLEPKVAICLAAKSSTEDESIEILRPPPEVDCRLRFDDQATECSSSFSGTDSDLEDESCSVDSELRDGNKANDLTEDAVSKRKKRALNADWKLCREGIEWQCRWLELRIQRFQAESNKYTRTLEDAESRKAQRQQDGFVSRTSGMGLSTRRCRVFRRRRRRRAEECVDSMIYMSSHPVFSNYEKQKQPNQHMSSADDGVRDAVAPLVAVDDFNFDVDNEYEDNIVLEKDSVEQYLWQIQALQMRISDLKEQLVKNSPVLEDLTEPMPQLEVPRSATGLSARVHSPSGFGGRSMLRDLKGQGGASSSRRRNSDFDINNVIMPDPQLVNYVEPVRHVFIETPHWRLATEPAVQDEESSDEDTDDEVYKTRHALMQDQERQSLYYSPLVLNRSRSLSTTKERPRSNIARRGSVAKERIAGDFPTAIPTIFGHIPKGRRRKRPKKFSPG